MNAPKIVAGDDEVESLGKRAASRSGIAGECGQQHSAFYIPDIQSFVRRGGDRQPLVPTQRHAPDTNRVYLELGEGSLLEDKEMEVAAGVSRHDPPGLVPGAAAQGDIAGECERIFSAQIPDFQGAVLGDGKAELCIGAEIYAPDVVGMSLQGLEPLELFQIPNDE